MFTLLLSAILAAEPLPVSVRLSSHLGVHSGDTLQLSVLMQSPHKLGGIDFSIHFIDSIFRLVSVEQDTGLKHWEWFTPSYDSARAIIRVVSIADLPFPPHPDSADFYPKGSVVRLGFIVLPTWNQNSSLVPFTFFWGTCGDNAGSNAVGDTLLIIHRLFDFDGQLVWDETDNSQFPESIRPPNIGVADSCQQAASMLLYTLDLKDGFAANYGMSGDADGNLFVDISYAVYLISYIFSSGPAPVPLASGDVDGSGSVDISDTVYLLNYIFSGGAPPSGSH
ncbi:MAG: hypothetical protein E4G91_02430 [Candidatus Zixiibacteriota bacterium]|nr:MAG: hypothetical protein E4G91_02430 [candidate division Zixibacteria bacterium]